MSNRRIDHRTGGTWRRIERPRDHYDRRGPGSRHYRLTPWRAIRRTARQALRQDVTCVWVEDSWTPDLWDDWLFYLANQQEWWGVSLPTTPPLAVPLIEMAHFYVLRPR